MFKLTNVLVVLVVLLLAVIGCQKEPNQAPTAFDSRVSGNLASTAAIESATLYLYAYANEGQDVTVHRVTSDWDEMAVTWANFGGAFDATVWETKTVSTFGWNSFDITALVQAWADGDYTNYGLLLDQATATTRQYYFSSDDESEIYHPYVVLCMTGGDCDTIYFDKDTYINENEPDVNFGDWDHLSTGHVYADREKQTLIWFPVEVEPELGELGNYVWYDANMDGIQDDVDEESGVPDVIVHLYACEGGLIATDTTDESGYYLFDSLPAGNYVVHFVLPDGYVFTLQDQGDRDDLDSDADPTTGETDCITLDAGEIDYDWDAGIYRPEQEGCTRTIGYWKTHAGFGPQADAVTPLLPIWLGTDGGAESIQVTTAGMAVDYLSMNVYGTQSNGITKLYAQLLGAKLSIASGASDADVAAAIAAADAFLATHDYGDWSSLTRAEKTEVLGWQYTLDQYNNGLIGPGHCEEIVEVTSSVAE